MLILSWLLSLSILVFVVGETVVLHHKTVCRQEAWLKSTEVVTGNTLSKKDNLNKKWIQKCKVLVSSHKDRVTWQRLPNTKIHKFEVYLEGKL